MPGQLLRHALGEHAPLRRQQDHGHVAVLAAHGFDRRHQRAGHHHHTAAAAIRRVIDGMVFVGRIIANVVPLDADQIVLLGALEDALGQWTIEHVGKQRQNIDVHGHPTNSGQTLALIVALYGANAYGECRGGLTPACQF